MGVGGQRHAPAAVPLGMTRYPLYITLIIEIIICVKLAACFCFKSVSRDYACV
jgi:hypothetical protein